jgi:uncharacterized protein (DUF1778 family)
LRINNSYGQFFYSPADATRTPRSGGQPRAHDYETASSRMKRGSRWISLFFVMTMALHALSWPKKDSIMPKARTTRRDTLNLRIRPEERGLIDRAATLTGKTRTDFVLEAARQAAEETLLDQTVFAVSREAYAQFLARLDEAPKPNERLRRTMQTVPPWDSECR